MDIKELKELMSSFDSSGISELKWSDGQTNLILKKERGPAPVPAAPASAADNQTQEAGKLLPRAAAAQLSALRL